MIHAKDYSATAVIEQLRCEMCFAVLYFLVLTVFDTQLVYIIMRLNRCQHLFLRFFNFLNLITTSQRWNYIVPFPILLVNY